jgi:hypothetical protein
MSLESNPQPGEPVFFLISLDGVRLSPLGTLATVGLLCQPRMIDDDYGAVGGMRTGRGNEVLGENLPQIPHDLTWDRTRAAAVGSQRLTAWAVARPEDQVTHNNSVCLAVAKRSKGYLLLIIIIWRSSPYRALASSLWGSVILHLQTIGRTPWTSDQPVARPLPTQDTTNTE